MDYELQTGQWDTGPVVSPPISGKVRQADQDWAVATTGVPE
jgi:hypothetical protein